MSELAPPGGISAGLLRPAAGLSLLGQDQGGTSAKPRYLIRRSDGQTVQVSQLLYLVTVAVAEATAPGDSGGRITGVSPDLVAAQVSAEFGQPVSADIVRGLVRDILGPLGVVTAGTPAPGTLAPAAAEQQTPHPLPEAPVSRAEPEALVPGPELAEPVPGPGLEAPVPGPEPEEPVPGPEPEVPVASAAPDAPEEPVPGPEPEASPGTVRKPRAGRPRRRTVVLAGAGIVAAAGVAAAVFAVTRPAPPAAPVPSPASWTQAAAWVADQVSPATVVSCDPAMCAQLRRRGFPAARLMTLVPATHDPLGSAVVVATPAVRSEFGTRLDSVYAPMMIAGFGSGASRVEVRTTAPDGVAALEAEMRTQRASLISEGRQLLRNPSVRATPAARAALLAGRVDARLLANLSVLSSQLPITLVAFGDDSPGATAAVPLRGVQLSADSATGRAAILDFLHAQRGAYRPSMVTTVRDSLGKPVVSVRFDAPGRMSSP
jgi:hypothetical protein